MLTAPISIRYAPRTVGKMTSHIGNPLSDPSIRRTRAATALKQAVAVGGGWLLGMLGAFGVITANAKMYSGPLTHPTATWFVGYRSAALAVVVACWAYWLLPGHRKHLVIAAAIGTAAPLATLFWLYL
jgi:hypothetical protein